MKKYTLIVAAALICAPLLSAQETGKERIRREVAEKQKAMRSGKVVRANRRVTVRLKNGSRMRGVVKDGKFIELVDGLAFVPLEVKRPGAGLRLWYYDHTTSFIFLPYKSITKASIGEELTDEEVREIGRRIGVERREAQKRAKKVREARKLAAAEKAKKEAAAKGGGAANAGTAGASEAELPTMTPAQTAWIKEYPPKDGWGIDKVSALERRKIVVGVYPNKVEKRFIDNFKTWNEAYQAYKKIQDAKAVAKAAAKSAAKSADKPAAKPAGEKPASAPPTPVGEVPVPLEMPPVQPIK